MLPFSFSNIYKGSSLIIIKMTRINLNNPEVLADQHLLAELRELPRIFSLVGKNGVKPECIPEKFKLGKGHVNFFRDKLKFLFERYLLLHTEAILRGFNLNHTPLELYNKYKTLIEESNSWQPSKEDIAISKERILEKINSNLLFYRWTKY